MRLTEVKNASLECLAASRYVVLASSGYEARARALPRMLKTGTVTGYAVGFKEYRQEKERVANDRWFRRSGYCLPLANSHDASSLRSFTRDAIAAARAEDCDLFVDLSSMSRVWQASVVQSIAESGAESLRVHFGYVPGVVGRNARRSEAGHVVKPLDGFFGLQLPTAPLALVIGLGQAPERALGLAEALDPKLSALFLPRREGRSRYNTRVRRSNREVIESTPEDWVVEYAVGEPAAVFMALESLAAGLTEGFRVVLSSLGPKHFGVLCLLVACRHPEISVWRVSSRDDGRPRSVRPDVADLVVFTTEWSA